MYMMLILVLATLTHTLELTSIVGVQRTASIEYQQQNLYDIEITLIDSMPNVQPKCKVNRATIRVNNQLTKFKIGEGINEIQDSSDIQKQIISNYEMNLNGELYITTTSGKVFYVDNNNYAVLISNKFSKINQFLFGNNRIFILNQNQLYTFNKDKIQKLLISQFENVNKITYLNTQTHQYIFYISNKQIGVIKLNNSNKFIDQYLQKKQYFKQQQFKYLKDIVGSIQNQQIVIFALHQNKGIIKIHMNQNKQSQTYHTIFEVKGCYNMQYFSQYFILTCKELSKNYDYIIEVFKNNDGKYISYTPENQQFISIKDTKLSNQYYVVVTESGIEFYWKYTTKKAKNNSLTQYIPHYNIQKVKIISNKIYYSTQSTIIQHTIQQILPQIVCVSNHKGSLQNYNISYKMICQNKQPCVKTSSLKFKAIQYQQLSVFFDLIIIFSVIWWNIRNRNNNNIGNQNHDYTPVVTNPNDQQQQ